MERRPAKQEQAEHCTGARLACLKDRTGKVQMQYSIKQALDVVDVVICVSLQTGQIKLKMLYDDYYPTVVQNG